jgi:hypothetical protein
MTFWRSLLSHRHSNYWTDPWRGIGRCRESVVPTTTCHVMSGVSFRAVSCCEQRSCVFNLSSDNAKQTCFFLCVFRTNMSGCRHSHTHTHTQITFVWDTRFSQRRVWRRQLSGWSRPTFQRCVLPPSSRWTFTVLADTRHPQRPRLTWPPGSRHVPAREHHVSRLYA